MVSCSLIECGFPDGFEKAIITPHIKMIAWPKNKVKSRLPLSRLGLITKFVELYVASQLKQEVDTWRESRIVGVQLYKRAGVTLISLLTLCPLLIHTFSIDGK